MFVSCYVHSIQVVASQRDTAWHTWTIPLGFPVMGIWPEGADGTDINHVDRSKSGKYLVTAGDDGFVSLFAYPSVIEEAACRSYRGHSAHVMATSFNATDTHVVSAGGRDRCLFQFRLEHVKQVRRTLIQ